MKKLLYLFLDRTCELIVYQPKEKTANPTLYLKMFGIMLYEIKVTVREKEDKIGVDMQINKI